MMQNSGEIIQRFGRLNKQPAAMTLIELLVAITIVTMLMALLFPALNAAREASRQSTCAANLRQFGIGMLAHAQRTRAFCSGAFDWQRDGCVTEIGWVADLVNTGTPVGKMLCPSAPAQISRTFNDLLNLDVSTLDKCVDRLGSPSTTTPDGKTLKNPCRAIVEDSMPPGSEARRALVESQIFEEHYNTNYTASWWLVRSGLLLDSSGNVKSDKPECPPSPLARHSTSGPLTLLQADTASMSASFIPLLGCGGAVEMLTAQIGPNVAGAPVVASMTPGPVRNPSMKTPTFESGTPSTGPDGTWAVWNATLQDFRNFAPVHRHVGNLLFADGSVRSFVDEDKDDLLNNGFLPLPQNGFATDKVELPTKEVLSKWSLRQ